MSETTEKKTFQRWCVGVDTSDGVRFEKLEPDFTWEKTKGNEKDLEGAEDLENNLKKNESLVKDKDGFVLKPDGNPVFLKKRSTLVEMTEEEASAFNADSHKTGLRYYEI